MSKVKAMLGQRKTKSGKELRIITVLASNSALPSTLNHDGLKWMKASNQKSISETVFFPTNDQEIELEIG